MLRNRIFVLVDGFHGFSHWNLTKFEGHDKVHQYGEQQRECGGHQEASGCDILSKDHIGGFRDYGNIVVEDFSQYQSQQRAQYGKNTDFPENVSCNFLVMVAQNSQGSQFTDSLININIGQVVQHHSCQHSGENNQNPYQQTDAVQNVFIGFF